VIIEVSRLQRAPASTLLVIFAEALEKRPRQLRDIVSTLALFAVLLF
jgi:hypothetical protein